MEKSPPKVAMQMLSVGQISQRSGIPVSTLHFYETKGLIRSRRNAGNQRRYPRHILRQLAVIKVAQSLGLSLSEIREHMETLPQDAPPSAADWNRLSSIWREELEARIAQLKDGIAACEREIEKKRAQKAAADALFGGGGD